MVACSLYGEERLVTPVPGTRFASWVAEPFVGMHFCNFAPTAVAVQRLQAAGVVVGATAPDAGAEVLEFPDPPVFVTSLFQPQHRGPRRGAGAPARPRLPRRGGGCGSCVRAPGEMAGLLTRSGFTEVEKLLPAGSGAQVVRARRR